MPDTSSSISTSVQTIDLQPLPGPDIALQSSPDKLNIDLGKIGALMRELEFGMKTQPSQATIEMMLQAMHEAQQAQQRFAAIMAEMSRPGTSITFSPGATSTSTPSAVAVDPWHQAELDMQQHLQSSDKVSLPSAAKAISANQAGLDALQALLSSNQQQSPTTPSITLAP